MSGAIGIIHSIDEENYTARAKLPDHDDYITEDLQIFSPLTFRNTMSCIPAINTPVMVFFFGERGFIVAGMFSDKNRASKSKGKLVIDFQKSNMVIDETGKVGITTEEMTVTADNTTINSKVKITGDTEIGGGLKVIKDVNIIGKALIGSNLTVTGAIESEDIIYGKDFIKK